MKTKLDKLDELKGKNPFRVPGGYLEGLDDQIMAGIPVTTHIDSKVVSLRYKIRPWLYAAAVFAGLLIILRVFINPVTRNTDQSDNDSSYLQAFVSDDFLSFISDDDLEYLEYIENQYIDREFAKEIDNLDY